MTQDLTEAEWYAIKNAEADEDWEALIPSRYRQLYQEDTHEQLLHFKDRY